MQLLVEPLLEARPQEAHILITTRSHWIGERLNMPIYQLDVLDADEAMALLQARLGSRFRSLRDTSWTTELFTSVGYHTLALDIVLYLLKRVGADRWAKQARTLTSQLQHGQGFEQLRLDSPDRQRWVELSLRLSYDDLTPPEQSCFRQLGVMAADSDSIFAAENIAEIWQLPLEQTYVMLERLTGAWISK